MFLGRFHIDDNVAVLPPAATLTDMFAYNIFYFAGDRFFIRDLRPTDIRFQIEFALHAVNDNFQMQFSHSGNDRLGRFMIIMHA